MKYTYPDTGKTHHVLRRTQVVDNLKRAIQKMMVDGDIPRRKYLVRADVGDTLVTLCLHDPDTEALILTLTGTRDGNMRVDYAH
jgi:hypothetical protein